MISVTIFHKGDFRARYADFESLESIIAWSKENPKDTISLDSDPVHYYRGGVQAAFLSATN